MADNNPNPPNAPVPLDFQALINVFTQVMQAQNQMQQVLNNMNQQQQPPAFARTPATANNNILDYSKPSDIKIYKAAKEALPTEFSLKDPNVDLFLEEWNTRATGNGLVDVLTITTGVGANPQDQYILDHFSLITLAECRAQSQAHLQANGRAAQNIQMIYECVTASVDSDTRQRMSNLKNQYQFTIQGEEINCGVCYLLSLLQKAEITSRAITSIARNELAALDEYMINEAQDDIDKFNEHVRAKMKTLSKHRETSNDILVNMFRGYKKCKDKDFVQEIKDIEKQWERGGDLTWETLLTQAENQYHNQLVKQEWKVPDAQEEEIIALRVKFDKLKNEKEKKKPSNQKQGSTKQRKQKNKTEKPQEEQAGETGKTKKKFSGKQAWRNKPPKPGKPTSVTKTINGEDQTWHYCTHHGYWVQHTSEECRLNPANKDDNESTQIRAALASVNIDDIHASESDSESE